MDMEVGIDKRQLEALKAIWHAWCRDPVQLRFVVVLVITTLGYFAVMHPATGALAAARKRVAEAEKRADMAEAVLFYRTQVELYESRSAGSSDITDWQNYLLDNLSHTNLHLASLEPRKSTGKGPFKIIEMEMLVRGQLFAEIVDFIDRLERGPRLLRLERMRVEKQKNSISFSCTLKGMVKPSANPAEKVGTPAGDDRAPALEGTEAGEVGGASAGTGPDDVGPRPDDEPSEAAGDPSPALDADSQ
jgi:hypothetical protein